VGDYGSNWNEGFKGIIRIFPHALHDNWFEARELTPNVTSPGSHPPLGFSNAGNISFLALSLSLSLSLSFPHEMIHIYF